MKRIECIIMDWAGTAVDYGCFAPVAAFVESFRAIGVPVTAAETRAHMGLTKVEEIRALFNIERVRGSTTGYTRSMMDVVLPAATAKGYAVDNCVTPDGLPAGRPAPYMIYKNMADLAIPSVDCVLKYGDTIADIKEGINAKAWTVGVVLGSNELGLTQEEVSSLPADELEARKADVRRRMLAAGAHYVVDTIAELPAVIAEINRKLEIL